MVFPWQKRNVPPELAARVPPGQVLTEKFPVLHFGRVPSYGDLTGWDFRVWGEVSEPFSLRWAEFRNLPISENTLDIHCVTRWSKLDTTWEGVAFSHIAEVAQPTAAARYVIFHSEGGYTANVPLATAMRAECTAGLVVRRPAAHRGAWVSAPGHRARHLLLEEREVAARGGVHRR